MRSNAGMAKRQGDVDLRFAQVSVLVNTLSWLGRRIIHSSAATRRQNNIASIKKEIVVLLTSRRNSRACHLKRALPELPHHGSIAGPVRRGIIVVCTTTGDVCLRHQREWYCRWRSEGSVVRHQYHRHPQAAHRVPAIQPGTSLLHT